MRKHLCLLLLALPLALTGCAQTEAARSPSSRSPTTGAVAAPQKLAAEYGAQVLREGGNAVDAAVATALMLGVVDGHNSGIGGGCFILIHTAEGEIIAIDGREKAPALATRDMFIRGGKADARLSTVGPLAVGTPGMLAACDLALREHGTKSIAQLLGGAADVAERGFVLDEEYAARLRAEAEVIRQFPATAAMLLKPDGAPYNAGETLRLPDLARTYRAIADNGIDWFYGGEFAAAVDGWMRENGGLLRAEDFAAYEAKQREPVITTYRGYTVAGFPPPSSGGVHVAQILNILENFDLASLDEAARRHVIVEAMKLAFADRAHWLGDPDFARVPRGLASQEYADELAKRIRLDAATKVEGHGAPPGAESEVFPQLRAAANVERPTSNVQRRSGRESDPVTSTLDVERATLDVHDSSPAILDVRSSDSHTAHLSAADEHGNFVALTSTVNTGFGSKVVVPGTGVVLNNQMDDFSAQPGVRNVYGLVGAEANAIEPGKRPLSSMSPTIVLEGDHPILTVGAAGGPRIISATLQTIINYLDLGMPLADAVAAGRMHHQWSPDELLVEESLTAAMRAALEQLGHGTGVVRGGLAVVQAVGRGSDGFWIAVADTRAQGGAVVSGAAAR